MSLFHTRRLFVPILALALVYAAAQDTAAQHADVLVSQDGSMGTPRLLIGGHDFDHGESFADIGLFEGFLEDASVASVNFFSGNEPGMNGVTAASGHLPPGYFALDDGPHDVFFDINPISIDGGAGELFLWDDGAGKFNLAPADYTLELEGTGAIADGMAGNNAATTAWATTTEAGFFHEHRNFLLFDNDAMDATRADVGVYLLSLIARVAGFDNSDPFYLVLGAGLDEMNEEHHELLEGAAEHVAMTFGVTGVEEEVIPEPSSAALLAAGMCLVGIGTNRRVDRC